MFTDKAQNIIDLAKDCAFARAKEELDIDALLAAVGSDAEAGVRLAECLTNGDVVDLRGRCPDLGRPAPCPGKMELTEPFREILKAATELASGEGVPDRTHPGLIDITHLICAIASSRDACRTLGGLTCISQEDAMRILTAWYEQSGGSVSIADLVAKLRGMRAELLSKIFGQDHAVYTFVEGLYNAEITAAADTGRKRPAAVFVFAGPPGVGKTYMSELCASYLGRPFKRFDMTSYSDHQAHMQLIGVGPSYKGAQPGALTGFVEKNPNAFLLFDEIEKAHLTTVQLFYQILDAGRLEDKFAEHDVSFRDTVIIFTTNTGRSLYDNPNKSGINAANSSYHKQTILSALQNEKNPANGLPAFPPAICSRLAQGYPVMFNHLGVNELERIAAAELTRTETLLEKRYFKKFTHDPLIPISLVLREGGRADARQLRSETEKFAKTELFKFASLYANDRLEDVFDELESLRFTMATQTKEMAPEIQALFESLEKPRVMLVANARFAALCREHIPEVVWFAANSPDEAADILNTENIDMVLMDIWVRRSLDSDTWKSGSEDIMNSVDQGQDYVPFSARALDEGRSILRKIQDRFPQIPVYLLSFTAESDGETMRTVRVEPGVDPDRSGRLADPERRAVDDELFLACVRAGGARGLIVTDFVEASIEGWEERRKRFARSLKETNRRLYREKKTQELARERKTLMFETISELDKNKRRLNIRLRDFRLARAIDAEDAGELVDDVQRPNTRFEDVVGAEEAKAELAFFIDYLKNPQQFLAQGLKPPKGVLLHGPPGTGKTMLARAMAGESNCAFLQKAASSFVTMWQGSGPQNIRDLFDRARRYAPAIVFIDEIDSIGRVRTGSGGGGQANEDTLNALLAEMDGFAGQSSAQPVFVLAATNFDVEEQQSAGRQTRSLDPALVRRFSRKILVGLPERAAREEYLMKRLENRRACTVSKEMIKNIAERSPGMSIANLESIVETASREAVKAEGTLTDKILEEAYESVCFGDARAKDPQAVRRTARHEAGHTIMYWLSGWWPSYVTVVARGEHGGYMQHAAEEAEQKAAMTRDELLAKIRTSLGGRAAEIVYYGREGGLSSGASGDLEHATNICRAMVCRYGMDTGFGLVATPELLEYQAALSSPVYLELNKATGKILSEQMEQTVKLLEENRSHLHALAEALVEKERLTREDLQSLLPPIAPEKGAVL